MRIRVALLVVLMMSAVPMVPSVAAEKSADRFALVALNFDCAVLDGAAAAAGGAHFFRELFFFRQTDPDETVHHGHRFSAAVSRLAPNIDAAAVFFRRG